jgi:ribosomal peptide maturation radical SAM protein 1
MDLAELPQPLRAKAVAADIIVVVPPFGGIDRPALGAHVLQALAHEHGIKAFVLYLNIAFANRIGASLYEQICYAPTTHLPGERIFAFAAHGKMPRFENILAEGQSYRRSPCMEAPSKDAEAWQKMAFEARSFVEEWARAIVGFAPKAVGATTTFEQTNASLSILRHVRALAPTITTLLGGANCDGDMAFGLSAIAPYIDHVFSGESEKTFGDYCANGLRFASPSGVVEGTACEDMDSIPTCDFSDYYAQFELWAGDSYIADRNQIWLPYETSRGCWWGQKHHCTFCGINGNTMKFRQKSARRVLDDLEVLLEAHPSKLICMVDNIMPMNFFETLIPKLAEEFTGLNIFYEQKANLSFDRVEALKLAGVNVIQPGIEALSTDYLNLMKKGVSAAQNVALLRYSRATDLSVNWNILYGFPGDKLEWLEQTRELIPFITHLNPPTGVYHLSIDRFSPYFNSSSQFGLDNVRALDAYHDVMPADADLNRIAYHFEADYVSETSRAAIVDEIGTSVSGWRALWNSDKTAAPVLELTELSDGMFLLLDTRPIAVEGVQFLSRDKAEIAIFGSQSPLANDSELVEWALASSVAVLHENSLLPLTVCSRELHDRLCQGAITRSNSKLRHLEEFGSHARADARF